MYELIPFKYVMRLESKGLKAAAFGEDSGEYAFLSSGQKAKFCNSFDHDGEYIVIGDGGIFNSKYINGKFSASDHTLLYAPCKDTYAKFIAYYLEANKDELDLLTFKGMGMRNISRDALNRVSVPLPNLAAQQRIAAFLDERTGKIEALVNEFAKFKSNLQLQKRSLISECVTKGLPSERNRAYKDSGVEWLGEVPASWTYGKKLGLIIDVVSGLPFPSDSFNLDGKGFPLIRIRDIVRGYTETYADVTWEEKAGIYNGDILVGMDGDFNVEIWKSEKALLNQRACKIEGKKDGDIFNKFLYYAIPDYFKVINDLTYATTVKHLSTGDIKNIKMPIPPLGEQKRIADYLDVETARIDSLIAEIDNQSNLLKTYRKSLINEVVTGKFEV